MKKILFTPFLLLLTTLLYSAPKEYRLSNYGIKPNSRANITDQLSSILKEVKESGSTAVIVFEKGRYDFHPTQNSQREYYISNHDQDNPKNVAIPLEGFENLTIEGNGAEIVCHGVMLPISITNNKNCNIKNLSIDFEKPHIAQVEVLECDTINKIITYEVAPWVDFEIRDNKFINKGDGWERNCTSAIAFNGSTSHIVYRTSDVGYPSPTLISQEGRIVSVKWDNPKLIKGTTLTMRGHNRPAPAIFVSESKNTLLEGVTIHYAEGMGLLAQMSKNITLNNFKVALKDGEDPRFFTTQADATHFSGCKGRIVSTNGLYENMMDDAINIHGTYLKIEKRIDDYTVEARYMHNQSWGFKWGEVGDKVQFIEPKKMELTEKQNIISRIEPKDKPTISGAKIYTITFKRPIEDSVIENFGIENLSWTPKVIFSNNIVRNNRARGSLFSTPKKTIVEENFFDHTSGSAILLCGDCNGWFETGACRKVIIKNNHFLNALTNMFQFTNGVISIFPEIPNLQDQQKHFHGGSKNAILIENNTFESFDEPLLYAKSVNGVVFRKNKIIKNSDFTPFHHIDSNIKLEKVINFKAEKNISAAPLTITE